MAFVVCILFLTSIVFLVFRVLIVRTCIISFMLQRICDRCILSSLIPWLILIVVLSFPPNCHHVLYKGHYSIVHIPIYSFLGIDFISLPLHSWHSPLNVESSIRCPRSLDFSLAQHAVHLFHTDKLLDLENHTGELRVHGVEDGLHSTAQAQRGEDTSCALGKTDS